MSPDGKYAMNGLFLFDAVSRRPLIELPVPTMRGGFLSSGRHLYLYDAFGEKIAVFEISQLLKTAKKCSWGRPKWINEK